MRAAVLALAITIVTAETLAAQQLTGSLTVVTVKPGDTLRKLGSRFGVDAQTIAGDNDLSLGAILPPGLTLTIDNRHIVPAMGTQAEIVVNVPQRMLFVRVGNGVVAFPVAVGRPSWSTPLGPFQIAVRETNPTWDVPESIREEARRAGRSLPLRVAPGPANPLGAYWLGLSLGSVGIHGTNAPSSIYQAITHGCIRLHPDDIAALFAETDVGNAGEIVYEPLLLANVGGVVFLEAHRDVYARGPREALGLARALARDLGLADQIDWDRAAVVIAQREGIARDVSRRG
jgi:L,D-transpeptidase ErfK/SrfK